MAAHYEQMVVLVRLLFGIGDLDDAAPQARALRGRFVSALLRMRNVAGMGPCRKLRSTTAATPPHEPRPKL